MKILKVVTGLVMLALVVKIDANVTSNDGRTKGIIQYSFGRYEGYMVDSIPEGQGTMYYTCRIQIATHGRSIYFAEKGDIFSGTWSNGDILNGNLRDMDGEQKAAILAGKRKEPYNLSNDSCLSEDDEHDEKKCFPKNEKSCKTVLDSEVNDNNKK